MYAFEGKYVVIRVPDRVWAFLGNKQELEDRVKELDVIIESMYTGKIQPWPGTEKEGDLIFGRL